MTDVKQKALDVAHRACGCGGSECSVSAKHVLALLAANLLHDPEEVARGKEALEACVAFAEKYLPMSNRDLVLDKDVWMRVHDAGRAELERRKPRPRWRVANAEYSDAIKPWAVLDETGLAVAYFFREHEASKYADWRNAEEAK